MDRPGGGALNVRFCEGFTLAFARAAAGRLQALCGPQGPYGSEI